MEEQLISFETAKLAKKKKFDSGTSYKSRGWVYSKKGELEWRGEFGMEYLGTRCSAPTQSLLQKWLREKHKLFIEIQICYPKKYYHASIYDLSQERGRALDIAIELTYEEVLERILKIGLNLIKNGKLTKSQRRK